VSLLSAPEVLKFPGKNLDVQAFYRAATVVFGRIGRVATEEVLLQLLRVNVFQLCYMALKACPPRK